MEDSRLAGRSRRERAGSLRGLDVSGLRRSGWDFRARPLFALALVLASCAPRPEMESSKQRLSVARATDPTGSPILSDAECVDTTKRYTPDCLTRNVRNGRRNVR
jgi:hypothetical protein